MSFRIRSLGRLRDIDDTRDERVERLAFALAILGAEATLRHVRRAGTVTLYGSDGRELIAYEGERLAIDAGPFLRR